jgi:small subunit ribosomal protein S6
MLLSPEATEDEVSTMVERVDGLITGGGGTVSDHETWGVKPLAFPVKKFREGNYVLTHFALEPSAVGELNRSLKASESILRYLVTSV